ncbi:MAG: serine hydrolase [Bacteroidales bacterium]|nr:serine hydrolase [Bacteroidales bacterium]MDD3664321.1 serine hydrolase [Bacteroidales bacterium]
MRRFRFLIVFLPLYFSSLLTTLYHTDSSHFSLNQIHASLANTPPLVPDEMQLVQQRMEKILKKHRFNGSIVISFKGFPIYSNAVGLADFSRRDSLTTQAPFQLASVSKSFTAMAVMILKERGLVQFDDTLTTHIPEFPYKNITIRHLLNHTSGLPNYMYLADKYWPKELEMSNEDMLELLIRRKQPLYFKPGSRFDYSNTGYAILALLVERKAGISFGDFARKNIFEPIGMFHTFTYNPGLLDTIAVQVKGYRYPARRGNEYPNDPVNNVLGDKSIYSTAEDLALYERAWVSPVLVSDSTLQEAYTKPVLKNKREVNYGFGWRFKEVNGKEVVFHNGLWHGFTSTITRFVESDLTVIVLTNTSSKVGSIVFDVARDFDGILL